MNRSRIAALLISAIAAGCGSSPPPISLITVTGKVTNTAGPVVGVKVVINGQPAVTTDLAGSFTVSNVAVPYDALVGNTAANQVYLYKGLRRTDPVFGTPATYSASVVSGTLNNLAAPWNANTTAAAVSFGSPNYDVPLSLSSARALPDGTYAIPPVCSTPPCILRPYVTWRGSTSLDGTLHALQWEQDQTTKLPTTFSTHGSLALTVADGGNFAAQNISMAPIGTDVVEGVVSIPSGYTVSDRWIETYFPPFTRIYLGRELTPAQPTFSYKVPSGDSATAAVWISGAKGDAWSQVRQCGISPGSKGPTAISLSLPVAPELSAPADATVNVTKGTTFSWSSFPSGGVHTLFILGDNIKPSVTVFTTGTQVELPDLSTVGMTWPSNTAYQWNVVGFSPLTVDDWADPVVQMGCSFTTAGSVKRNFTTSP